MNLSEHITAGVLAGLIIRATLACGSFVGLFVRRERHMIIMHHNRSGHIAHFAKCSADEHCSAISGMVAAQ